MWDTKSNLKQELLDRPQRFEFFEAARWLTILARQEASAEVVPAPAAPEADTEEDDKPQAAAPTSVRFRTAATGNFPAGEVEKLEQTEQQYQLFTHVIGLFGAAGVLPHQDKDLVSGGEPSLLLRDFLDMFNSRIIELFFEVWQANRPTFSSKCFAVR